jgi:hypothetical protein
MILGIDPGPVQSAFCLWDGSVVGGYGLFDNEDVRGSGFNFIRLKLGLPDFKKVAVEHLQCYGMPVGKDVFETAYWIGEFRGAVSEDAFIRVYRSEVKLHFCNSMRAKDSNIRQALIDRLGKPGTKKAPGITYGVKGDIWSALAIAVMVHDKRQPLQSSVRTAAT